MVSSRQQHAEGRHTHNWGNEQKKFIQGGLEAPQGKTWLLLMLLTNISL